MLREVDTRVEATLPQSPITTSDLAGGAAFYWAEIGDADAADHWLARLSALGSGVADRSMERSAARLRVLLLHGRPAEALAATRDIMASGRTRGWHDWLVSWAALLGCAADVFEAAGSEEELRSTLYELADAYRRKGNHSSPSSAPSVASPGSPSWRARAGRRGPIPSAGAARRR